MSEYPDSNKLAFFSCSSDDDSIDFSDSDEEEEMNVIRKSLKEVLDEEQISDTHQSLILNTLTWSIKDRFTISQVRTINFINLHLLLSNYCI